MLSRFSELPVLSNFLSKGAHTYAQSDIDSAISHIKALGKRDVNNSDECLSDIRSLLSLMRRYERSLHVQRVSCHAISNLAMHVVAARYIVAQKGFKLIQASVRRFKSDHKLAWLASSAVWNCARPPCNRAVIGVEGVRLMFEIINEHKTLEKVCNTAIGALSNLSLENELKCTIAEAGHMDVILKALVTHVHMKSVSVMTSGAGLLANLAVSDEYASVLVNKGVLSILLRLLTWNLHSIANAEQNSDTTLYRNTCAALNNLVTADGFLDSFLLHSGVEAVLEFLSVYRNNELYTSLLENCLINIDADSTVETTSLHLACYHGKVGIFKRLYTYHDLNATDGHSMTLLDYAITRNHPELAELLCKCGARHFTTASENVSQEMRELIQNGSKQLRSVRTANAKALIEALPHVPTDVCKYMVGFQHNVDMLKGMELY